MVIFMILILVYMIFNAPVWGIALLTAPFIFQTANGVFGTKTSRKLIKNKEFNKKIQRALKIQSETLYLNAKRNLSKMDLLKKYHYKHLNPRRLEKIANDYFYKYKPQLGKQFHKQISKFSKILFQRENKLKQLIKNM